MISLTGSRWRDHEGSIGLAISENRKMKLACEEWLLATQGLKAAVKLWSRASSEFSSSFAPEI